MEHEVGDEFGTARSGKRPITPVDPECAEHLQLGDSRLEARRPRPPLHPLRLRRFDVSASVPGGVVERAFVSRVDLVPFRPWRPSRSLAAATRSATASCSSVVRLRRANDRPRGSTRTVSSWTCSRHRSPVGYPTTAATPLPAWAMLRRLFASSGGSAEGSKTMIGFQVSAVPKGDRAAGMGRRFGRRLRPSHRGWEGLGQIVDG